MWLVFERREDVRQLLVKPDAGPGAAVEEIRVLRVQFERHAVEHRARPDVWEVVALAVERDE